jgi:DNA modification methylase
MILQGDNRIVMQTLDSESFHCCITSPPYLWVRDYGCQPITLPAWTGCLGLEPTVEMFVAHIVLTMRDVWRLLRKDGTLWLNFGDTYYGSGKGRDAGGKGNPGGMHKQHHGQYSGNIKYQDFKSDELKDKDLIGIPWRIAFALQADGWWLRMDNIWSKLNCMPESVRDRPTKAHEYVFLLAKSEHYYCDMESIKEPITASSAARLAQDIENQSGSERANGGAKTNGNMKAVGGSKGAFGPEQSRKRSGDVVNESGMRNKRSVWTVATAQMKEAHFATFPEKLIEPCVLAGCPFGGRILDPFGGSGTTRKVALENNRECTLIEINPKYIEMEERRTAIIQPKLF